MSGFASQHWHKLFHQHKLTSFEQLWELEGEPANATNYRKNGSSTVSRVNLPTGEVFYLKKQNNYYLSGLPLLPKKMVAQQERDYLVRYQGCSVATMELVYFKRVDTRCIFVTSALQGYQTLDLWLTQPVALRRKGLRLLGQKIAKLHQANILHRCLYPWHIYIKEQEPSIDLRLIDLEKSRFAWWRDRAKFDDIARLYRYCKDAPLGDIVAFLQGYAKSRTFLKQSLNRRVL